MPKIAERRYFNGAEQKIQRLGLGGIWSELEGILTGFQLKVLESVDANGGAAVRELIYPRFEAATGWTKITSGGIDWTKCHQVNGTRICIGVEIQVSARSDLLIVDVIHLRDEIFAGRIDVGVIVVATDELARYLTDRAARFSDAVTAVERARATDLPLAIIAFEHDGPGPALPKKKKKA